MWAVIDQHGRPVGGRGRELAEIVTGSPKHRAGRRRPTTPRVKWLAAGRHEVARSHCAVSARGGERIETRRITRRVRTAVAFPNSANWRLD